MARPTKTEVLTGEFSLYGEPWIYVGAKSAVDVDTLEFSLFGEPWHGTEEAAAGGGDIKTINGIALANVKTWSGVAIVNVKTIDGITK